MQLQVYLGTECAKKGDKADNQNMSSRYARASQHMEVPDSEGQTQKRGNMESGADKYRVTIELRHVIYNYFDEGKEPVGEVDVAVVIAPGARGRLSNIDDDGRFHRGRGFQNWRQTCCP